MFLVEKKNGGYRPVLDLSPLNTFIETTHFKMENLATLKSLINPGDYMINIDLTDAYLSIPIHQESQKFLRFIWQNKAYQFKAMPFGLKCSSQGIHEAIKTGRSLASRPGNPSHHILRRHFDNGFLCGISKTTQTNNYSPSGIIRVPDKLRQVNVNPNSKDSIPRVVDRFDTNVVHSARNKNHVNSQSMSTACQQTTTNYSRSLTGYTRILPTGSVVNTVTLSSASRTSNKFTETVVRLQPTNTSDTPSQGGLIMVDKQSTLVKRQSNTTSNCRYYDNIRCCQNGLGCFHGNPDDRRQVVAGGSTGTHQYSRTQSGIFCSQVVLERQNKPSDLLKIGQHYGGSVLEQHGGHTLSSASSTDSRDLGMVRKEKRISSRPTYSRSKQYGSRCRVPSCEGLERLEAEVRCDPPINNRMPNRPICITPVPPARQICQLETGPQRIIHGCLYNQLEQHDSVSLSSVQSHPCSPAQSESRECDPGVSSSTLVGPTVVASVNRNVDRLPSVLGKQQGTPDGHVESLAVWKISGDSSRQLAFQTQLSNSCQTALRPQPPNHTTPHGLSGVAGVINGKVIPYFVQSTKS